MIASSVAQILLALQCFAAAVDATQQIIVDCGGPPVGGCGKPLPGNQVLNGVYNMRIPDGTNAHREFLLFVPPVYDQQAASPLILSFHGGHRTAWDQLELDRLTQPEFNTASIVVYPQGRNNAWEGVPGVTTDDVLFIKKLIAHVESLYCVDSNQIFATGKSDGGGFCGVLACDKELSTRIAAFAPVSGAFYVDSLPCDAENIIVSCPRGRTNIPFLEFHGGADKTIPYEGGERRHACLPSIPNYMEQWSARDNLAPKNVSSTLESDTTVYMWGDGADTGLVTLVVDASIGHDWPATITNADNKGNVASFNATPIIMDFFSNHPLVQGKDFQGEL